MSLPEPADPRSSHQEKESEQVEEHEIDFNRGRRSSEELISEENEIDNTSDSERDFMGKTRELICT